MNNFGVGILASRHRVGRLLRRTSGTSLLGVPLALLVMAAMPACGDSDSNTNDGSVKTDAKTDSSDARDGGSTGGRGGTTATGGRVGSGGATGTGGAVATGGATATGGRGTGGAATGGAAATGGRGTGGAATGGAAATGGRGTGGAATGGAGTGGAATGGAGTGGAATGGAGTGGAATGGAGTGGAATGGAGTGGAATGGAGTGGAATGGAGTGGAATGGAGTGGAGTGGAGTGGAGGACTAATFTTALFQNFENFTVGDGGAGEMFTSAQGFTGRFTYEPGTTNNFGLAMPGAMSDLQAVFSQNSAGASFVHTLTGNACLNLAGSTGMTFWAKGMGTLKVTLEGSDNTGTGAYTIPGGTLTSTFAQYSFLWTNVAAGPPRLSPTSNIAIFADGTGATGITLDNISFTTGP